MPSETDISNLALGKIGGAGEALTGTAFISSIDDDDKVSTWCKLNFPRARRRVISELATRECPFRATVRFADLEAQASSTPEIGQYQFAFNLPGDCLEVVRQFYEDHIKRRATRGPVIYENQFETIANAAGTGKLFLTDLLTNQDGDSAFIEYVIDTPNTGSFSEEMIDCVATLLASEVAAVVGKDANVGVTMLEKYFAVAVPNAQRANQKGFNNRVKKIPYYTGGMSQRTPFPAVNTGLGTFVDAFGNRRDI